MQNYEKDAVSEISKTDVETNKSANSEVISLLEDNDSIITPTTPIAIKKKRPIYKSPNIKPPSKISTKITQISKKSKESSHKSSRSSRNGKKKYRKDEHALVRAWRSRTTSPCPSSNSVKSSQFSIGSNLSFKEKKKILNSGAVKHPSIFTMKRVSSLTNSVISDLSSKGGSIADSFASFNFQNKHEIKRSSSGLPKFRKIVKKPQFSVKKESQEAEMPGLRRRVCRKVYNIIHKEFQRPKELAKKLTLAIEYRINKMTPHHTKQYLKTVKLIFKKLRVTYHVLTSFLTFIRDMKSI